MSGLESESRWIEDLKAGDDTAATKIWNHFYTRLVGLAYQKLREADRRVADEEDVVQNAFQSFFRRAQEGLFPRLNDRDDLWRLLITITERKALNQVRDQRRDKRGGGKVAGDSAFLNRDRSTNEVGIEQFGGPEPTPELAAMMTESFDQLLRRLDDDELRKIALWKLEGFTNEEIAPKINRAVPTVERRLKLIRAKWQEGENP